MEHIGNYYIGHISGESIDVAVREKRYEAEESPEKSDPKFWYEQSFDYSQGGYHPLGGIHTGKREDMFPEWYRREEHRGTFPVLQPGETCFRCGYEHDGPCSIEE